MQVRSRLGSDEALHMTDWIAICVCTAFLLGLLLLLRRVGDR